MNEFHEFVAADECLVCSLPEADPIHIRVRSVDVVESGTRVDDPAYAAVGVGGDLEETQPGVRSTTARRIHNRARNLAARWVREHHPDVWTALADRAADELGVPRSKVHGER